MTNRSRLAYWVGGITVAVTFFWLIQIADPSDADALDATASTKQDDARQLEVALQQAEELRSLLHAAHQQGMREALESLQKKDSQALEQSCAVLWESHQPLSSVYP